MRAKQWHVRVKQWNVRAKQEEVYINSDSHNNSKCKCAGCPQTDPDLATWSLVHALACFGSTCWLGRSRPRGDRSLTLYFCPGLFSPIFIDSLTQVGQKGALGIKGMTVYHVIMACLLFVAHN